MEPEYYIRQKDVEDSRGPFSTNQLSSLAEAGQIDDETLIYDVEKETWSELSEMPQLKAELFPERKKLNLKPKENVARLNLEDDNAPPITVDEMLAQAEGRTKDTKHKRNLDEQREFLAYVAMHVAAVIFLISGIGLVAQDAGILFSFDISAMIVNPLVLIGAIDLVIALILFLRTTAVYPFIRFRAALGVGFFALLYFSYGEPTLLVAAVAGSVGLYFCTITVALAPLVIISILGLGGMGYFAYLIALT